MNGNTTKDITKFFTAGINYKRTDATTRGQFAVTSQQYDAILETAPSFGINELFIVSTCNRTEIYGFADDAQQLVNLLCTQTTGSAAIFKKIAYIKKGIHAVEHLFSVSAGLDSQILGDYEIVGQLKTAVKHAKEKGFVGATLDRLTNAILQSSKAIKNQTELSSGTVSVSFAAVQYIKETITNIAGKKILLLGTGKIGRNTSKNLVDYLEATDITLMNRSHDKAADLAGELNLQHAPITKLLQQVAVADIILVATNAAEPIILKSHLEGHGKKLIIDLSIPCNVAVNAGELGNVTLVNVDELSRRKDMTLQKREAEVPKAKEIIAEHIAGFMDWYEMRRHVPVLKAVKTKLLEMHSCQLYIDYSTQQSFANFTPAQPEIRIQRVINSMAVKMRNRDERGCQYIEAINDYMATGTN